MPLIPPATTITAPVAVEALQQGLKGAKTVLIAPVTALMPLIAPCYCSECQFCPRHPVLPPVPAPVAVEALQQGLKGG